MRKFLVIIVPEIKVFDWDRKDDFQKNLDILRILSLLCFPKEKEQDTERNDFYFCSFAANVFGIFDKDTVLTNLSSPNNQHSLKDLIGGLLNSSAFPDLKEAAARNSYKANIAGEILFGIFQFSKTLPNEHIGVKKASHLLSKYGDYQTVMKMKKGEKARVKKPPARKLSKPGIEDYWEEYKSVAPFYAALRFFPRRTRRRKPNFELLKPDNFLDFLFISKHIEDFARNHIPKQGRREPLILGKDVWTVEANFSLPRVNFKFPSRPRWVKEALEEYKA